MLPKHNNPTQHPIFLMVTILQSCSLQQTCKPWKNSKAFFEVSPQPKTKKIQQKGIRYKKEKNRKMVTLEKPNHPTLHILGKQLGARLRLHPYPTKLVWIWPPFHNFVQKKVPVKQPPQTNYIQNWCNKVLLFSWKTDLQSHWFQTYNSKLILVTPIPLRSISDIDV